MLVLYADSLLVVATVPTGLQTCAKVLRMHHPAGGGTPWLQPNNNITFKLASHYLFEFFIIVLHLYNLIIAATVPTGMHTSEKMLQMQLPGGGGTLWLQPYNNITFKLASHYLFDFLDVGFVCR